MAPRHGSRAPTRISIWKPCARSRRAVTRLASGSRSATRRSPQRCRREVHVLREMLAGHAPSGAACAAAASAARALRFGPGWRTLRRNQGREPVDPAESTPRGLSGRRRGGGEIHFRRPFASVPAVCAPPPGPSGSSARPGWPGWQYPLGQQVPRPAAAAVGRHGNDSAGVPQLVPAARWRELVGRWQVRAISRSISNAWRASRPAARPSRVDSLGGRRLPRQGLQL